MSIVEKIREHHRTRCFAMEQRKRMDLALGAYLRLMLGWSRNLPEKERKAIAAQAMALMKAEEPERFAEAITSTRIARELFVGTEKAHLKEMEHLAKQLFVWKSFGEPIRGFGAAGLAIIVAEAGDLSNYATHSKLWKRMGVAAHQGRIAKGLTGQARKDAWMAQKYRPQRRSHMWNIGDALIKGNRYGKYRIIYLARKECEHARHPEMSKLHAHRRAQRYVEKRLLRDLWRAWRREAKGDVASQPIREVPPAELSPPAE